MIPLKKSSSTLALCPATHNAESRILISNDI